MVDFVEQHHITPIVDSVFSLEDGVAAFARMAEGAQFGKLVVTVS